MGILNVTPDSFSDGGQFFHSGHALSHAQEMIKEGATIIDVGGESTRPGADPVDEEEELRRVIPVIESIHQAHPEILISIDTTKSEVANQACKVGASIINDISGLQADPNIAEVAASTGAGLVVMHMQGTPRTMQVNPDYTDVVAEVRAFIEEKYQIALQGGISPEHIVFDPGIGFGKRLEHNLQLIQSLDALTVDDRPLLLGVSRKSMFAKISGASVEDRLWPTVSVTAYASGKGVRIHRVHDVRPNLDALRMIEAIQSVEI